MGGRLGWLASDVEGRLGWLASGRIGCGALLSGGTKGWWRDQALASEGLGWLADRRAEQTAPHNWGEPSRREHEGRPQDKPSLLLLLSPLSALGCTLLLLEMLLLLESAADDAAGDDMVEGRTTHCCRPFPAPWPHTHLMPLEMTRLRVASTVSCTAAVQFMAPLLVT